MYCSQLAFVGRYTWQGPSLEGRVRHEREARNGEATHSTMLRVAFSFRFTALLSSPLTHPSPRTRRSGIRKAASGAGSPRRLSGGRFVVPSGQKVALAGAACPCFPSIQGHRRGLSRSFVLAPRRDSGRLHLDNPSSPLYPKISKDKPVGRNRLTCLWKVAQTGRNALKSS